MVFYLTIKVGPDADHLEPLFATTNRQIIAAVGELIAEKLGARAPRALAAVRRPRSAAPVPPKPDDPTERPR